LVSLAGKLVADLAGLGLLKLLDLGFGDAIHRDVFGRGAARRSQSGASGNEQLQAVSLAREFTRQPQPLLCVRKSKVGKYVAGSLCDSHTLFALVPQGKSW
jgi:hypothetical protein